MAKIEDQEQQKKLREKKNQGSKYIWANVKGKRIKKQDKKMTTQNKRRDKAEHERRREGRQVDDSAKTDGRNA